MMAKKAKYWDKTSMVDVELLAVYPDGQCAIVSSEGQLKVVDKKDLVVQPDTS